MNSELLHASIGRQRAPMRELDIDETREVGGGLIGLLLLGGAALLLAGCQSCTAHGNGGKEPTNPPGN